MKWTSERDISKMFDRIKNSENPGISQPKWERRYPNIEHRYILLFSAVTSCTRVFILNVRKNNQWGKSNL